MAKEDLEKRVEAIEKFINAAFQLKPTKKLGKNVKEEAPEEKKEA